MHSYSDCVYVHIRVRRVLSEQNSRTFKDISGLNFRIQGLFEWAQMNLLTCTLNVLINIVASAVGECG